MGKLIPMLTKICPILMIKKQMSEGHHDTQI